MPQVFGWQHIVYFILSAIISAAGLVAVKLFVKSDKTSDIIYKCLGAALFVLVLLNRIFICIDENIPLKILPNTLCGITNTAFAVCLIFCKKNSLPFHCLVYVALLGGLATSIYPYYLPDYPAFMYSVTITSLLHHSLALFISLMMLIRGDFKPSLKKFFALPVGISIMLTYGIFLIDCLGFTEAINIFAPLVPGTILCWYFVFPALILSVLAGIAVYEHIVKTRSKKRLAVEIKESPEN